MVLFMGESIYKGEKIGSDYYVVGTVDRDDAEKNGIRHYTAIIVPFVMDGEDKGKWIVHDRTAKQWAKKKPVKYEKSYNLIGGHIKAEKKYSYLIGKTMPPEILLEGALEELSEELFTTAAFVPLADVTVQKWVNEEFTNKEKYVARYYPRRLISIGYTEYTSKNNVEFSYVYALPIPEKDLKTLISADDYGKNMNVELNLEIISEGQLFDLYKNNLNIEVCDAITRLWQPDNAEILDILHTIIGRNDFPMSHDEIKFHEYAKKKADEAFSQGLMGVSMEDYDKQNGYYADLDREYRKVMLQEMSTEMVHECKDHLGIYCKCKLCGQECHDWEDNDDGTFAASGKVVTVRCKRCGETHHYYSDTGTDID
jgi:translation initiation factor 2 beta subunit (eIF-2beta)/eIF-5